jgi:hypothetical protein
MPGCLLDAALSGNGCSAMQEPNKFTQALRDLSAHRVVVEVGCGSGQRISIGRTDSYIGVDADLSA